MDAAGKLVLLVEDSEKHGDRTVRALSEIRMAKNLVVAATGERALELLFGSHSEALVAYQVMLLDLDLPGMKGHEVLRRVRVDPRTRHLPVVVLTSSTGDDDVLHSYSLGANGFVRKPLDFDKLVQTVKALGPFWFVLNEAPAAGCG